MISQFQAFKGENYFQVAPKPCRNGSLVLKSKTKMNFAFLSAPLFCHQKSDIFMCFSDSSHGGCKLKIEYYFESVVDFLIRPMQKTWLNQQDLP